VLRKAAVFPVPQEESRLCLRIAKAASDPKQKLLALGCGRASAARRGARGNSAFKGYFDCAGHCDALLSWHRNHVPVSFSAIARSKLIAAFAGLTCIRIKVGAAIHTVRLRVGRHLGIRLSGIRQDRHQTQRKAGN
jgi:hypothetical protein